MTIHMPTNDAAAANHVWAGVRIHAMDIVQPPGIGIALVVGMEAHHVALNAVLTANAIVEMPKNANRDTRSATMAIGPGVQAFNRSYSSWRRHHTPVSFRPFGARSSHWYMPQRPSSPRA
jgi:hypothetical protein